MSAPETRTGGQDTDRIEYTSPKPDSVVDALTDENARLRAQLDTISEALAAHPRACDREEDPDASFGCGWKSAVADIEHAVRAGLDADIPTASRAELERFVSGTQPELWHKIRQLSMTHKQIEDTTAEITVTKLIDVIAWFGPLPPDNVDSMLVETGVYGAIVEAAGHTAPDRYLTRPAGNNDLALISLAQECAR